MPTSAPGSNHRPGGFTLLELLVVVAIIAVAVAGVSFAVRDAAADSLQREAERLAALLEAGRAQSRLIGQPVRWVATEGAFRFDGLPPEALPQRWLAPGIRVAAPAVLVLGPEPIIGPQAVLLTGGEPPRSLRVVTDGLRPFTVDTGPP